MDKIEVVKPTGFPVRKKTIDFLQQAYGSLIEHLCKTYGNDNLILYGCDLVNGYRTAGAVVINGELLPFEQSIANDKIEIIETVESDEYFGGEILPAYHTRKAICSGNGTVSFASLRRIRNTTTGWVTCIPTGEIEVIQTIQVRINERGKAQLRGRYRNIDNVTYGNVKFTIPESFRPAYDRALNAIYLLNETSPFVAIPLFVANTGSVYANGLDGNGYVYKIDTEYDL